MVACLLFSLVGSGVGLFTSLAGHSFSRPASVLVIYSSLLPGTQQLLCSLLKLLVLEQIDERIDATVGEGHHRAEIVEWIVVPVGKIAKIYQQVENLAPGPAQDEAKGGDQKDLHKIFLHSWEAFLVCCGSRKLALDMCQWCGPCCHTDSLASQHQNHPGVRERHHYYRDQELKNPDEDTKEFPPGIIWPNAADPTSSIDDFGGADDCHHAEDARDPHRGNYDECFAFGEGVAVDDRVDDFHVALDGQCYQVVSRHRKCAPQEGLADPQATQDVSTWSSQVVRDGQIRGKSSCENQRPNQVNKTLIDDEHVGQPPAHRSEAEDHP